MYWRIAYTFLVLLLLLWSCNEKIEKGRLKEPGAPNLIALADSFYKIDNFEKFKLCYDSLIHIDSTKARYFFRRAYSKSMTIDIHNYLDETNAIIDDYQRSLLLNYENKASVYLNIGAMYNTIQKYDSALYFLDKCLTVDPGNLKAIKDRIEILKVKKRRNLK